jgi:chemotaxis protein MotA
MDFGSACGIILAFSMVLVGAKMEDIAIEKLIAPTAGMIVIGGTAGAVILQFPIKTVVSAAKGAFNVFLRKRPNPNTIVSQIVEFAKRARREGILALERDIPNVKDPFFAQALRMAIDGLEPKTLMETMETELSTLESDRDLQRRFWEAAGGYAPTVGILGAVIGLIHAMSNLDNPQALGPAIATAFVATIYGVGFANLVFLPFASKIGLIGKEEGLIREMALKGVMLIQEGINHSIIEEQLKSYLDGEQKIRYEALSASG